MDSAPKFVLGNLKPSKDQLRVGIWKWVRARVDGAAHFTYLQNLSYDDMMLLARAMGYDGPGSDPIPEKSFQLPATTEVEKIDETEK